MVSSLPLFQAYSYSDFFGKSIFIFLFILSIVSWVILIEKIQFSKNGKNKSFLFKKTFEKKRGNILSIAENLPNHFNPFYDMYFSLRQKSLEILSKNKTEKEEVYLSKADIDLIENHMEGVILEKSKKLEKNLFILSTIVTLAPFLGLLGTVWGILLTFSNLQAGFSSFNKEVLFGISTALATTVFGLVVAIPALVGYNYLKNIIKNFISDMYLFSSDLMVTLEMQYRRVEKK